MKYSKKLLTFIFAIALLIGLTAIAASAQRRGGRQIRKPVIVRYYYVRPDPFWYWDSWNNPYYYDPYYNERRQRNYLENELSGNQRELRKHLEQYNADGVLSDKERRELADDYRDVERAERNLKRFNRRY